MLFFKHRCVICNHSFCSLFAKKKLSTLTMESDRLKAEIVQRKDLFGKIEAEMKLVEQVSPFIMFVLFVLFF